MARKERKGIATEQIFYIVIGIAVVSLLVLLVVNYSGKARTEGQCTIDQNRYCESWAGGEQPAALATTAGPTCTAPSAGTCKSRGYDVAVGP